MNTIVEELSFGRQMAIIQKNLSKMTEQELLFSIGYLESLRFRYPKRATQVKAMIRKIETLIASK